jgi:uncharacterized protein YcfJ
VSDGNGNKLANRAIWALAAISIVALIGGIVVATLNGTVGAIVAIATGAVGGIVAIALKVQDTSKKD